MTYRGNVRGGVVVLDDGVRLPEGMAVLVSLAEPTIDVNLKPIAPALPVGNLDVDSTFPDLLRGLQEWYAAQCDGNWEHAYGIEITTLDNPGWLVKIDLEKTELQTCSFQPIKEKVDIDGFPLADRWLHCSVKDAIWRGAGDQTKLAVILKAFLDWADREARA